jgi:DNA-binding MarR family transcriptional regulator
MPKKKTAEAPSLELLATRPGYLVRRLNQIHYAIFLEECRDFGITPVQYGMLTALSRTPGMDQKTLGHEVGLDRTNTADVLKRLEERGLVRRVSSTIDGRVKNAFITPEGETITRGMFDAMARAQERLLEPLSPTDRDKFMELLLVLVDANNELGRAAMRSV